jgi:hypothetical protein
MEFLYGLLSGIFGTVLIAYSVQWITRMIDRPNLDVVPDVWVREKSIGVTEDGYSSTSTEKGIKFIGDKKEDFIFYGVTLKNTYRRYIPKKTVIVRKAYITIYDKNKNIVNPEKEVRWWHPDLVKYEKLFIESESDFENRRKREILEGDKESLVLACKPINQNIFYRFPLLGDRTDEFLKAEDKFDLIEPKYVKLVLHCESGQLEKKIKVSYSVYTDELQITELRKFPFE